MADTDESEFGHESPYSKNFDIKRMERESEGMAQEDADFIADGAGHLRRPDPKLGPRLSGTKPKGQGSFRTARISDGTYDGYDGAPRSMRAGLARTGSFARSISSQATYRDPFNGSFTTAPRTYLRSYSAGPPPLPSSVTSWKVALEEALTTARAPLASLPQTLSIPAKENDHRHSHSSNSSAPCFHCAEAVQARAHEQKLEAAKQAAELEARQARAELAAAVGREAVLEGQVEILTRKVGDAVRAAETAERSAGEEHEAALAAAAEWRKKSLEAARQHAAELAAVSDELKDARRQSAAQADQARRDAEGAYTAEREQLKERASELEEAKEKLEAALRVTDEELKAAAARMLKVDEAVEQRTQELRRKLEEVQERHRLLQGDNEALCTTLDVAKQTEATLRRQLADAGVSLGAVQAELESAREEAHRWRRECCEAQEVAREMVAEKEEQRRRKAERSARPFDEVREELEGAMARALERHGIQPDIAGLSDDAYRAAMARLQAQRAQTEKQRQRALAREGGDLAALNRATSYGAATGRRTGPGAAEEPTFGRPRANSMPAQWEHRQVGALPGGEMAGRTRGERPRGDAKNRARGEDAERGEGVSVESSPEHMLAEAGRHTGRGGASVEDNRGHYEARGTADHYGDGSRLAQLGGSGASTREGEAGPSLARRQGGGGSGGSSVRSSPSREEEGSELADSDWAAPRPPQGRTSGGPAILGRGPLSC